MSGRAAREVLARFAEDGRFDPVDIADDPPPATPEVRQAAIDHLVASYVTMEGTPVGDQRWWDGLATRVIEADDDLRQRFVDDVLLRVDQPAAFSSLMPTIRWLLGADKLTAVIAETLDTGADRQRASVLGLLYYAFGHVGGMRLGEKNRDAIVAAVDRLRARPDVGPLTAPLLEEVVVPHDPIT